MGKVPYSSIRQYESLIFTAGQLPIDLDNSNMGSYDIEGQVSLILSNMKKILEEKSSSLDNILSFRVFLTDLDNLDIVNKVFREFLIEPYPTRTAIEISRLPNDSLVEIEAIAHID